MLGLLLTKKAVDKSFKNQGYSSLIDDSGTICNQILCIFVSYHIKVLGGLIIGFILTRHTFESWEL